MSLYCFGKIAISPADADALRATASKSLAPLGIDIQLDRRRDVDPEDANDLDTLGFVDDGLYFAMDAPRGALDVTELWNEAYAAALERFRAVGQDHIGRIDSVETFTYPVGDLDAMRDTRLARLPSTLHALPSYTKLAITFAEAAIEDVRAASFDDCFERVMKWAAAPWDVFPSTLYIWERGAGERSDMPM